ncbi:hypothetical protein F4860DRAFT_525330 [Xylaria cubensis]|nr:hypothetical protein F4860DRAFT_525330 [Xylaria cubensis]
MGDDEARERGRGFVVRYSSNSSMNLLSISNLVTESNPVPGQHRRGDGAAIIITGATCSLGAHLVARFAQDPAIEGIICLNRRTNSAQSAFDRQKEAMSSRDIIDVLSKVRVFERDTISNLAAGIVRIRATAYATKPMHVTNSYPGFDFESRSPLAELGVPRIPLDKWIRRVRWTPGENLP